MSCKRSVPVNVVFIETIYVETDELHFKSVVQKLTGKCRVNTQELPERMDNIDEGIVMKVGEEDRGLDEDLYDVMESALISPVKMTMPVEVVDDYDFEPTVPEEFYDLWSF